MLAIPPFTQLLSTDVELGKRVDLVLYQAIPNRCPMRLHVGFHPRPSFTYAALPGSIPQPRGLAISQLPGKNEVGDAISKSVIGVSTGPFGIWRLLNSVFIHFYRRNEPFKQLFRRFLAPSGLWSWKGRCSLAR